MKFNKWTVGLAAVGLVSLASAARADEQKMSQVQTALSDTTLSGYVDVAATFSPGNTGAGYAFGGAKAQANGVTLNAVDIALDKPQDESPWASGYHVELMLGANTVGAYPIRQAYLTLRTPVGPNGIDWKVGYFDTIIGYESNSSPLNPNYTHSYAYSIEPTSHTGVIGTYQIVDGVSVTAGVADDSTGNGFNTGMYQPSLLGALTLTAPDSFGALKGASLTAGVIDRSWFGDGENLYLGATIPTPMSALKFGAAFDYLEANHNFVNTENSSLWNVALYGSYQATDKLAFNVRAEYLDGDYTASAPGGTSVYGKTAAEELTFTVQYNLWANVLSRAEFRWDHVEHGTPFASPNTPEANAYMFAVNLIYQF
ncbi:MAG TPA: outer membrane beta-barrel protein [Verrucomicrobiae bacterium]|nr:outer membrane beta-barrel protein [Verrucomicrobiae bacterium]